MSKDGNWLLAQLMADGAESRKKAAKNTGEFVRDSIYIRGAAQDRWGDFGFTVAGLRPVQNEQEESESFYSDPDTLQPLFDEQIGESSSLAEALELATEAARKPRFLWVEVHIRVGADFLGIGKVAVLKDGEIWVANPRRLPEHEERKPKLQ